MENTNETGGEKKDLFIRLKIKKSGQCETRPEGCNRLSLASIEVNEERSDTVETLDLSIHIQSQSKVTKTEA
ncbi:MAG: hypothetical protein ACOZCO_00565 [Bacteroidota bacterium]